MALDSLDRNLAKRDLFALLESLRDLLAEQPWLQPDFERLLPTLVSGYKGYKRSAHREGS